MKVTTYDITVVDLNWCNHETKYEYVYSTLEDAEAVYETLCVKPTDHPIGIRSVYLVESKTADGWHFDNVRLKNGLLDNLNPELKHADCICRYANPNKCH